jgi:peptide methionine sulfoxide reductase MsrA
VKEKMEVKFKNGKTKEVDESDVMITRNDGKIKYIDVVLEHRWYCNHNLLNCFSQCKTTSAIEIINDCGKKYRIGDYVTIDEIFKGE